MFKHLDSKVSEDISDTTIVPCIQRGKPEVEFIKPFRKEECKFDYTPNLGLDNFKENYHDKGKNRYTVKVRVHELDQAVHASSHGSM